MQKWNVCCGDRIIDISFQSIRYSKTATLCIFSRQKNFRIFFGLHWNPSSILRTINKVCSCHQQEKLDKSRHRMCNKPLSNIRTTTMFFPIQDYTKTSRSGTDTGNSNITRGSERGCQGAIPLPPFSEQRRQVHYKKTSEAGPPFRASCQLKKALQGSETKTG